MTAGGDPLQFWRSTPREIFAFLRGARRRLEAEHDAQGWLAWHVANLVRTAMIAPKRMPTLSAFLAQSKAPMKEQQKRMSAEELELAIGYWLGSDK